MKKLLVKYANVKKVGSQDIRNIRYILIEGDKKTPIDVCLPAIGRPVSSEEITDTKGPFVNGFRVVETKNGEFGYVNMETNSLLPYRYDVALDFNEYGFAMVAKDGKVTWIDRDFHYLNEQGEFIREDDPSKIKEDCFEEINDFSQGDRPLSRIFFTKDSEEFYTVMYLDTTGKIKEFVEFDGQKLGDYKDTLFENGQNFDESGFCEAGFSELTYAYLSSQGYYIVRSKLFEIFRQHGLLLGLDELVEKLREEDAHRAAGGMTTIDAPRTRNKPKVGMIENFKKVE